MRTKGLIVIAVLFFWSQSYQAANLPKPTKSKYFESLGAFFMLENNEGVRYAMTYGRRKPLEATSYGVVLFQNPEDKKTPYRIEIVVEADGENVLVQSPVIPRIKKNKIYRVEFLLYKDEDRTRRINKHVQKILFSLPDGGAEQFGIELLD